MTPPEGSAPRFRGWFDRRGGGAGTRRYLDRACSIAALEGSLAGRSDEELRASMAALRSAALSGASPDSLTDEVFAAVRECSRRHLGLRPYDVQVAAGLAMAAGGLAELSTGEGKTLAAVPVACLLALPGRGVHVLTFNDYLARRDAAWMAPIYSALGFSVAAVAQGMAAAERRRAYAHDITYLTAKEAGFDYLRDGLALEPGDRVQRGLHAAIVDEADSILIDEARVPLVIAGALDAEIVDPSVIDGVVGSLTEGRDFDTDGERRNVFLTGAGLSRVEAALGVADLYAAGNTTLVAEVQNGLHARVLLSRDVDYIVRDGRIELVDEFTGRVVEDRLWPDGLQAAIEAKEGVRLRPEGRVLGSTTLQHFEGRYGHLCGMTATAAGSDDEFREFYGLGIVPIPTHRPCVRADHVDRVFVDRAAQSEAVLREIESVHATGRPVLVGTASVAESERLAAALSGLGIRSAVLNARNDEAEAGLIAQAGKIDAVTISTNMAGRGTDIRLGGADGAQREAVAALGGLHVIGTQRHESRRIDDQLRGRAGRQADPGSSRFFVSLDDDLFRRYGDREFLARGLQSAGDDASLARRLIHREIERAQRIVDGQNFDTRRTLHEYSGFLDRQRESIQAWRQALLEGQAPTPIFEQADAVRFRELCDEVGAEALAAIERRITLVAIDRCFGDHLGRLNEIRDAVHLSRAAGRGPLDEFQRRAGDAFEELVREIEGVVGGALASVRLLDGELDYEGRGLERPSATWTYTINDDPFRLNPLAGMATSIGLAAGMSVLWPLLLGWSWWNRRRRGRGQDPAL